MLRFMMINTLYRDPLKYERCFKCKNVYPVRLVWIIDDQWEREKIRVHKVDMKHPLISYT